MLRALFSGVAGLKAHQTKMDVIGNNIANVNTYGFKSSRATFQDVFYQTLTGSSDANDNSGGTNATQIGYGSMISSIDVLHTRAGYASTGRGMDAYINGEGYFIAQDGAGNEKYTRVGNLGFDGSGNLVDANGSYICGYPISRSGSSIIYQTKAATTATANAGKVAIDFGENSVFNAYTVQVTHAVAAAAAPTATIDTDNHTIHITVTSPLATDPITPAAIEGALKLAVPTGANAATVSTYLSGIQATSSTTPLTVADVLTTGTVPVNDGNAAGPINTPAIDKSVPPTKITKPGTLTDTTGDGLYDTEAKDVIELTNIAIGSDGIISGTDKNGNIIYIGQIALANIANPEAMTLDGNSYYTAGSNTGGVTYEYPGQGVSGSLVASGLEMSNVDLSNEMSEMITTQRGFQANSRIITVGDTMLEELINLKR